MPRWPVVVLDERLEVLHVACESTAHEAELVADGLQEPLGLEVHLQRHPGRVVVERVERDDAGVRRPGGRRPCDPLVGDLLGDGRVELPRDARDVDDPVQLVVAELGDRGHAVHEHRELLELSPLVVRDPHGNLHIDRVLLVVGVHCRLLGVGETARAVTGPIPRRVLDETVGG